MSELVKSVALDNGWIQLIKQAKDMGMTKEEIRAFLLRQGQIKFTK
ncbi:anti-repressor SinI family protein [Oceanobacillus sp. Castelsardo]|nr:anti-repressor SinI family protein [Oceanobacillus sp. Castelsardo]